MKKLCEEVLKIVLQLPDIDIKSLIKKDANLKDIDIDKLNLQNLNLKDLNLKKINLEELEPSDLNLEDLNLRALNLKDVNPNDLNVKTLILKYLNFMSMNKKLAIRGRNMKKHIYEYLDSYENDPEVEIIQKSFSNVLENPDPYTTFEECLLFQKDVFEIFKAVSIFTKSIINYPNDKCRTIERKLFKISFIPNDDYSTRILPVYLAHDTFLSTNSSCSNFKSSTGSGKTRIAPFFFAIKALLEDLKHPFFIMTQPSFTIIRDKIQDFQEILGDSVVLINNKKKFESMYNNFPQKPVVALFTPRTLVRLLSDSKQMEFPIAKYSRFALDEVHERSVDTDVLIALLSKEIAKKTFPLHLLMMSATPDQRLFDSFKEVELISLPNTQLFPVREIKMEVGNFSELDKTVRDSTMNIINDMISDKFRPGHILIFTSGNKRINNLMNLISTSINEIGQTNDKVRLLKNCENFLKSKELFYDHLDEVLLDDDDQEKNLYFLVMKYAGFLSNDAKIIGRDPIPNHPNIIKVIVSTNSIESSVTIDGLAAVVDSGIRNTAVFNKERGIKVIEEGPISIQSQTQRRGRVGRVREGVCVQVTIRGRPPIEFTDPSIQTDDISSNILDFKKIGINLENIDNLPAPGVPKEIMKKYLKELVQLKALDKNHDLTDIGSQLASFPSLAPFASSSILTVAQKYRKNETIASIVGALIFIVLNSLNLCNNAMSDCFRKNFCEDSDIITLLSSLFDVMLANGTTRKKLEDAGFNVGNAIKVIGSIEQIASIIYDEDDKKTLWNDMHKFYSSNNMMSFIQDIMSTIQKVKPDWVKCRQAEYLSVVNIFSDYSFIYNGSQLLNDGKQAPQIRMRTRPGGKGFAAPGACFIMQIECSNDGTYRGSIIHRDLSRKEICHPKVFVTSNFMNNVYTVPLIEGYIGKNREKYQQFQPCFNYNKKFFNGVICYPEQYGNQTIISYVTNNINDDESDQLMKEAIDKVKKIIPFTPRTILVRNDVLKAIVAVTSVGGNNFTSKVILYTDKNPNSYQIDEVTINYLIDHLNELNSVDDHLVIAVTGEKFSYLTENDDFYGFPTTALKPCVFNSNSQYYSHLVVLSEAKIPKAKSLYWVDANTTVTYSDVDALIHAANMIFRGIVNISHVDDVLYAMNKNAKVQIVQKDQKSNIFDLDFKDMTQKSDVFRPIGCMLDRYAMSCINGTELQNDVNLQSFSLSIPNKCKYAGNELNAMASFKKFNPNINPIEVLDKIPQQIVNVNIEELKQQRKNAYQILERIKKESDELYSRYKTLSGQARAQNVNRQHEIKNQKNAIYDNQINPLNNQIKQFEEIQKRFCEKTKIDEKSFNSLLELKKSHSNEFDKEMQRLNNDFYLEMECNVDDREKIKQIIKQAQNNIEIEIVPLCSIIVNHDKSSNLQKDEFEEKITSICNRFGGVIKEKSPYQITEKERYHKGYIKVILYTGEFAIPFAGEVRKAFGHIDKVQLKIPTKIIPNCLINRPEVIESIKQWIEINHLDLQQSGFKYTGNSDEISKAMALLAVKETQPKIPYKAHTIPGGIELAKITSAINRSNRKLSINMKWGINRSMRLIYTPNDVEDETVQSFIQNAIKKSNRKKNDDDDDNDNATNRDDDQNQIIFDYLLYCEETAVLSGCQIPLYNQNQIVQMKNFCITCAYDLYKNEVERLFDPEEDRPRMNLLCENVEPVKFVDILTEQNQDLWPEVPLGQLLWCLTSEPITNAVVKTWFSAIIYQSLHCSQYFDYCPNHPSILMRVTGDKMRCSHHGCPMFLCSHCHKWHKPGECQEKIELPPGYRTCPNCKRPVEKTEACNRLTCKCGKNFCYYCGWGPADTSKEVYDHLNKEHGGYFINPPDYRKYYLNENVPDSELQDFYKKYPHLKPS